MTPKINLNIKTWQPRKWLKRGSVAGSASETKPAGQAPGTRPGEQAKGARPTGPGAEAKPDVPAVPPGQVAQATQLRNLVRNVPISNENGILRVNDTPVSVIVYFHRVGDVKHYVGITVKGMHKKTEDPKAKPTDSPMPVDSSRQPYFKEELLQM